MSTDTNNVLDVRRRPVKAKAVQFTGKNGSEIVSFIKDTYPELAVRNGGSYVKMTPPEGHGVSGTARKGDWAVIDANGVFHFLDNDEFLRLFSIKG